MGREKALSLLSLMVRGCLTIIGIFAVLWSFPICATVGFPTWESTGPFKNWAQAVDVEGDGDLDVVISHTRWEEVDISWAGVGRWINHGDGQFEFIREADPETFGGSAAGVGDVDHDGDADVFVQVFGVRLLVNQGGLQGGEPGRYASSGGINSPPGYDNGYHDMGGMIVMGDLTGDGWIDAFVAGCCYGINPTRSRDDYAYAPSVSWVWINDGAVTNLHTGHILSMDCLDGRPIRQVAMGDLDGDGDLDVFAAVGKPTMGTIDSPDDLILLNDGTGMLASCGQRLGNTDSTSVALGDVNGDGRLDALVGTSAGARLWVNQSNARDGGPIFVASEQSFRAVQTVKDKLQAGLSAAVGEVLGQYVPYGSIRTKAVFLADMDGDGDPDALIARVWGAQVWWNDGQGGFHRSDVHLGYPEDTGVAVADFDGDGDQDVFVGRNEYDYRVWWNDGKGVFSRQLVTSTYRDRTK
jgi:hypothetical protein